jgi:glycosyltransferase involved in cell wall biosynthesis
MKLVAVIPVYNHADKVETVIDALAKFSLPVILVDDGSDAANAAQLDDINERRDDVSLIRLPHNQGKGAAVMTGMRVAAEQNYTHVLQIDADGQHDTAALQNYIDTSHAEPDALINGDPQYDASVPKSRLQARKISQFWVRVNTLGNRIADGMCGLRIYPLRSTLPLLDEMHGEQRMSFDVEILVRADWAGIKIINIPVHVNYPEDGVSHFHMVRDNVLISKMHAKMFFGMLRRLPKLLRQSRR